MNLNEKEKLILHFALEKFEHSVQGQEMIVQGLVGNAITITINDVWELRDKIRKKEDS